LRRGRGYHQFWWVTAACSLVQAKLEPGRAGELTLQATERVAELFRKTLEHMKNVPTEPVPMQAGDLPSTEGGMQIGGTWISVVS
jgi:hypothetical protein